MTENISKEDHQRILNAQANANIAKLTAEKAHVEMQAAELAAKNVILNVYVKYGLSISDQITPEGTILKQQKESKVSEPTILQEDNLK